MDMETLHKIDEELGKNDVAALKFLCMDHISKKRLEMVTDGKDLFVRMNELALFDDKLFLPELLLTIRRNDLLEDVLDTNEAAVNKELQGGSKISPYRKMLYELDEDMTNQNLRSVKFLLTYLPKSKLEPSATFLDILIEMEKMQKLGENNLDELVAVLEKCDKQMANKVQEFKGKQSMRKQEPSPESIETVTHHPRQEESLEMSSNSMSQLSVSSDVSSRDEQSNSVVIDAQAASSTEYPQKLDEFYTLTQRPCGICLIINNCDFKEARPLTDRSGTEKDAEDIRTLFTKLHFNVQVESNQSGADMQKLVKKYALKDHSHMDAFICFVLSHGNKGTVLGVDGAEVEIRDLTEPFTHCEELLGKPKLFFIQACQGKSFQRPMFIKADGEDDKSIEEDAERAAAVSSIPIGADILIGMSTMESFKSFRHTIKGSIYIQELCRQIEIGVKSKDDLLSILTRVNREVSGKMMLGYKQMPEPRYTLTKKVVFTVD